MPKKIHFYLVGGAVRDALLGQPVHDRDWVVTGATPEDMLQLGFKPVGKDFPVFLHPHSHEEYALARTERKVGSGYYGFQIHSDPTITLEQDLQRRDLTINALAQDEQGQIIDFYGGRHDLEHKLLRHISPAFAEDPVRILRVARFLARYASAGFHIAPETLQLMQQLVAQGEVAQLVPERVWQETLKALQEPSPEVYFDVLKQCGALAVLLPATDKLNAEQWQQMQTTLQQASRLSARPDIRLAAWLSGLPATAMLAFGETYRLPTAYKQLAELANRFIPRLLQPNTLSPKDLLSLFEQTDAFRKPERLQDLLTLAQAHTTSTQTVWPIAEFYRNCFALCQSIDISAILQLGYQGEAIRHAIQQQRIELLSQKYDQLRQRYLD